MTEIISATNGKTPPVRDGQKRKFTTEFKKELVARVKGGAIAQQVANEYDISGSVLRRWIEGEGLGMVGTSNGSKGNMKMSAATKKKISDTRKKMFKKGLLKKNAKGKLVKRAYVRVDDSMHDLAKLSGPVKEAIGLLKLGQKWMYGALQNNIISEFDEAHDLSRMALRELLKLKEK